MIDKEVKKYFTLSQFQEEEKWLADMHKDGWEFCSTTGRKYRFKECKKEDWVYQLDYKEDDVDRREYVQMYRDYGWECVYQYKQWYYFRKKKEGSLTEDLTIFSDDKSKAEMCKKILRKQSYGMIPFYIYVLGYNYITFFTDLFQKGTFFHGLLIGVAIGVMLIAVYRFGYFIAESGKLNKLIQEWENPIFEKK